MKTKIVRIPVLGGHLINTYLLVGKRPVLVDCGMPGSGDRVYDGITAAGIDPADLAMIVVTHGHVDHYGAAAELQTRTGAPVAAHKSDLPTYLAGHGDPSRRQPIGVFGHIFTHTPPPNEATTPLHPDIVLTGELRLDDYGIEGAIIPTPGHTAGSVSVLLDQGDVMAGDMIAGGLLGLVRYRPSYPPFHDDPAQALESLQSLLERGPHTLHVGHGGPFSADAVQKWLDRQLAQQKTAV